MKKQVKGLIALGTVTAVLGGGLVILKVTDKSDNDTSSSSSAVETTTTYGEGLVLIEDNDNAPGSHTFDEGHDHGEVESVKIKNSSGSFDIVIKTPATEENDAVYTIKGYEDITLMEATVANLTRVVDNITAAELIEENCNDLGKFGLTDDASAISIKYKSGRERTLYVGDLSPVSKQYYVRADGSSSVYTVASGKLTDYLKKPEEFVDLTMLAESAEGDNPKVESVILTRKDLEEPIEITYDELSDVTNSGGTSAKHVLVKPISTFLSVEKSTPITNGIFGLKADSVKCVNYTDKDMEEVGLKDPFCTAAVKCSSGNEYVLLMSKPFTDEDGKEKIYATFKDSKVIYVVTTENAKWPTITANELISRTMFFSFVWNITELTATTGDITEKFTISMKDSSKNSVDAKTADVDVKRNGEPFDAERFRLFNAFLIECHAETLALDEEIPKDKLMATVNVKDQVRKTDTTYEFYDYSVMKSLVVINGESRYFCSKKNAESLIANIKKIETGETFNDIS